MECYGDVEPDGTLTTILVVQCRTWTGNSTTDLWSDALNWSGGEAPVSGDTLPIVIDDGSPEIDVDFTFESTLKIGAAASVTVGVARALSFNTNVENRGTLGNLGTIVGNTVFDNKGALDNHGTLLNYGDLTSTGVIDNWNAFANSGTITSEGNIRNRPGATISSSTFITNQGQILNEGVLDNAGSGTIANSGTLENITMFTNAGLLDNLRGGVVNNHGTPVVVCVTDKDGDVSCGASNITIHNVAPAVSMLAPAPNTIFAVGETVDLEGIFEDIGFLDTHTASWNFDSATLPSPTTVPAPVVEDAGHGAVHETTSFSEPGIYHITLTVTDDDGGTGATTTVNGEQATIVVVDSQGGFVTAAGWFNSEAGAYPAAPDREGRASFLVVSKYRKNQPRPTGLARFRFHAAGLTFVSQSYHWLVVSGNLAYAKGGGKLNGEEGYEFSVALQDGHRPGGDGIDRLRMTIRSTADGTILYDNQSGASDDEIPTMEIGRGAVFIHKRSFRR